MPFNRRAVIVARVANVVLIATVSDMRLSEKSALVEVMLQRQVIRLALWLNDPR